MMNFSVRQAFRFNAANKETKNRLVLAPLTHNMSASNGDLSQEELNWLSKCAEGGFGMLITAATLVEQSGRSWHGQPSLISEHQQQQFKQIANMAKQQNALSIVQLHHGGMRAEQGLSGVKPVAPCETAHNEHYPSGARELSGDEISELASSFVEAAKKAYDSGMDGVELHAAHNFVLSSFLNPIHNKRQDQWGGSFNKRGKLLFDIVEAIRVQVPRDFIIGVRLSPESYAHFQGIEPQDQTKVANVLGALDVDYIHMSMHDVFKKPNRAPESEQTLLSLLKENLDPTIPLIVAGKISTVEQADNAIDFGADLVAIGRAAIGNPGWVSSSNAGKSLVKMPYTRQHLKQVGFTDKSIDYLSSFNGLVAA